MHREIAKPPKGIMVDQKNHNRADHTRENRRVCSRRENILNQGKKSGSETRFEEVKYRKYRSDRRKCYAEIRIGGKTTYLSSFDNEEDTARAYDRAAVEHHGETPYRNFPEEWLPERRAEVRAQRNAAKPRTEDSGQQSKAGRERRTTSPE